MTPQLREQVRQRANDRCEYCQLPQNCTVLPHEADHIRAQKHHGLMTLDNLCWACTQCNAFKGTDFATYVRGTDEVVSLFNPRTDRWSEHFEWKGPELTAKTKIAIATIDLLRINRHERLEHRRLLMQMGQFFTTIS